MNVRYIEALPILMASASFILLKFLDALHISLRIACKTSTRVARWAGLHPENIVIIKQIAMLISERVHGIYENNKFSGGDSLNILSTTSGKEKLTAKLTP